MGFTGAQFTYESEQYIVAGANTVEIAAAEGGLRKMLSHELRTPLAMLEAQRFDVMVSDIGLPDATGYELMRQAKTLHGVSGIALSGYGMEEDVRKSREAGFSEHLVKPVHIPQLLQMLRRVTGRD